MLRRFVHGAYYVWLDSDTNSDGAPRFCVGPHNIFGPTKDGACRVEAALWMGIDAARKLRDSLSEATIAAEEEQKARTEAMAPDPIAPAPSSEIATAMLPPDPMLTGLDEARDEDAVIFSQDGNQRQAVRPGFVDLQESLAGFGDTNDEALADLERQELLATTQSMIADALAKPRTP